MPTKRAFFALLFAVGAVTTDYAADEGGPPSPVQPAVAPTTQTAVAASMPFASPAAAAIQLAVAPTGNEVRYRVREQLVGFDFPNDAVGKSAAVSGAMSLDANGRVLPNESRFIVDATTFASDRDRRDGYVRDRLLAADQFPTITLTPTELRGVTLPLAESGTQSLELIADLTVRGVTRPTKWNVSAHFHDGRVSGTASTVFTFDDFQMAKPRVRSVLSVADSIKLEYDFNLLARTVPTS